LLAAGGLQRVLLVSLLQLLQQVRPGSPWSIPVSLISMLQLVTRGYAVDALAALFTPLLLPSLPSKTGVQLLRVAVLRAHEIGAQGLPPPIA
jgi:hypothetical protein